MKSPIKAEWRRTASPVLYAKVWVNVQLRKRVCGQSFGLSVSEYVSVCLWASERLSAVTALWVSVSVVSACVCVFCVPSASRVSARASPRFSRFSLHIHHRAKQPPLPMHPFPSTQVLPIRFLPLSFSFFFFLFPPIFLPLQRSRKTQFSWTYISDTSFLQTSRF